MPLQTYDLALAPLLRSCNDEELLPLANYLLKAATNTLDTTAAYKAAPSRPSTYVDELVDDLQTFGGHTFVNVFRGGGVPYGELARDVASKLKVKVAKGAAIEDLESAILLKVLKDAYEKMSPEEKRDLEEVFRQAGEKGKDMGAGVPFTALLAQGGVRLAGFAAYRVAAIVANAVAKAVLGQGLRLGANAALMRTVGIFAGPVGWAITGLWTAVDLAGPAYRVTIPAVCHVAYLRQKKANEAAVEG